MNIRTALFALSLAAALPLAAQAASGAAPQGFETNPVIFVCWQPILPVGLFKQTA